MVYRWPDGPKGGPEGAQGWSQGWSKGGPEGGYPGWVPRVGGHMYPCGMPGSCTCPWYRPSTPAGVHRGPTLASWLHRGPRRIHPCPRPGHVEIITVQRQFPLAKVRRGVPSTCERWSTVSINQGARGLGTDRVHRRYSRYIQCRTVRIRQITLANTVPGALTTSNVPQLSVLCSNVIDQRQRTGSTRLWPVRQCYPSLEAITEPYLTVIINNNQQEPVRTPTPVRCTTSLWLALINPRCRSLSVPRIYTTGHCSTIRAPGRPSQRCTDQQ